MFLGDDWRSILAQPREIWQRIGGIGVHQQMMLGIANIWQIYMFQFMFVCLLIRCWGGELYVLWEREGRQQGLQIKSGPICPSPAYTSRFTKVVFQIVHLLVLVLNNCVPPGCGPPNCACTFWSSKLWTSTGCGLPNSGPPGSGPQNCTPPGSDP